MRLFHEIFVFFTGIDPIKYGFLGSFRKGWALLAPQFENAQMCHDREQG